MFLADFWGRPPPSGALQDPGGGRNAPGMRHDERRPGPLSRSGPWPGPLQGPAASSRALGGRGYFSVEVVAHYGRLNGVHCQRASLQMRSGVHGNILN